MVVVVANVGAVTFTPMVVEVVVATVGVVMFTPMVVEVVANVGVVTLTFAVVVVVDSVAIVTIAPGLDFFDEVPRTRKVTTSATTMMMTAAAAALVRLARFSNSVDASLMRSPCSFNRLLMVIGKATLGLSRLGPLRCRLPLLLRATLRATRSAIAPPQCGGSGTSCATRTTLFDGKMLPWPSNASDAERSY